MRRLTPAIIFVFGCAISTFLSGGCENRSNPPENGNSATSLRIVSLSPAVSRTLLDFGLEGAIVGRTPHCASLPQEIPAVGDLLNIDYEQIIRLAPTHILVQPPAVGIDAHLAELAAKHGWSIASWKLNTLDDIETLVRELPAALYREGSTELADASRRASEIQNDMATALSPGETPLYRGSVLFVYNTNPVSVFGEGTYLDGILKLLGGANATQERDWLTLSLEDVVRIDPQAIIIVKPGSENINVRTSSGPIWELSITAVTERRMAILGHADALLPSTGVIGVATELRGILETFEALNP